VIRLSFVCLGNICRSPTAQAVMRHLVREAGLEGQIQIDSAGTGEWHVGEARDPRSSAVGQRRGMPLYGRARQFQPEDFQKFDYVLAMDKQNRDALLELAPDDDAAAKVHLLRSFDPESPPEADVPDPYYGGAQGFDTVFDVCEAACRGLLAELRRRHNL
jgi:protein-tyrosine phosphatase